MQKKVYLTLFTTLLLITYSLTFAQASGSVKHSPTGVFVFLGKEIPSGKTITAYRIERSEDNISWKQVAEVKTPATFDAFNRKVEKSKLLFPSQPIPANEKLRQLYGKACLTGNTDSLKGMRLLLPIRVALGVLFHDSTARQHLAYRYRVSALKASGDPLPGILTDTISLPFSAKFDTIRYSESSYEGNTLTVKWKSAGKNPAPLFMVYKFVNSSPQVAGGRTSLFTINDTTYFTFRDSLTAQQAGKELQYFIVPFDQYSNAGVSSQVAVITRDNFSKAVFLRYQISFQPKLSGVLLGWHFSDPVTLKKVEIYRSQSENNGFSKLAEVSAGDTSYLDQQIWPEKTYYYYLQATAKAGKRSMQSETRRSIVPGISLPKNLESPILRQVSAIKGGIRLLVEVNDPGATDILTYRGPKGGQVALPEKAKVFEAKFIAIVDSTPATRDNELVYMVRNEKDGTLISGTSAEVPVSPASGQDEVAYFYAFPDNGSIQLYWDDALARGSTFSTYTLARHYGGPESRSPLMIISEKQSESHFSDENIQGNNTYTYQLRLVDKSGNFSDKTWEVTVKVGD